MLLSIGELVDKLVIENIKIATIRERLHGEELADELRVELNDKMQALNANRGVIVKALDEKIESVVAGAPNRLMKHVRTYAD